MDMKTHFTIAQIFLAWLWDVIKDMYRWMEPDRAYHELLRTDDHMLRDIGIERCEIGDLFRYRPLRMSLRQRLRDARKHEFLIQKCDRGKDPCQQYG